MNKSEELRKLLIEQLTSGDSKRVSQAVNELKRRGLLQHRSLLLGLNLRGANLKRVDLNGAKMPLAVLIESNLYKANLSSVTLTGSHLSGANLRGAKLIRADLRGVNLAGANLTESDISGANLSFANLENAVLTGANLYQAIVTGANLKDANLEAARINKTDLSDANLDGANLRNATLIGTTFNRTSLTKTNFTNVRCLGAIFSDIDLSDVDGLSTVMHDGPSTVGIDTMYRSREKISKAFLRGCGVPESYIEASKKPPRGSPIEYYSCFISYSHADKVFARQLHDLLQSRGIRCWLDEHQMLPGDDPYVEIDRGIQLWDKMLLCCSKASLENSWWVDTEIERTFAKERELQKIRGQKILALIPLNLDGYLFSSDYEGAKGDVIKSRIAADFTGWEHDNSIFKREVENVIKALRTDGGKEPPPVPKL